MGTAPRPPTKDGAAPTLCLDGGEVLGEIALYVYYKFFVSSFTSTVKEWEEVSSQIEDQN